MCVPRITAPLILSNSRHHADILSHALADKEKEAANRQAQESHAVRISSARESAGLRISNFEDLPTVLSDDQSLFHTVVASHKVQKGKWYYEVCLPLRSPFGRVFGDRRSMSYTKRLLPRTHSST